MKICQVNLGLLPIPPNGWGAIEKIIWEYHCISNDLGHISNIKYTNELLNEKFDVIHQHVANIANMTHDMGLNYFFTMHDHHSYVHGKDSQSFKENMMAIENSLISFVPAKFLIPYFNNHPKLRYLEHGVNTNFFKPSDNQVIGHKLLCVANNGFAHDQGFDRKGFSYAINAARIMKLPITIAGPSNNKNFFERFKYDYDNVTIKYDLTEEELLKTYQEHTIFLHASILEAGHPNLTLLEAMACGLPVVATFEAGNNLDGLYRVERDINQIIKGITTIINNYPEWREMALKTAKNSSFEKVTKKLLEIYNEVLKNKNDMRENLIQIYNETPITHHEILKRKNTIFYSFIMGPKVEIIGDEDIDYYIEFIDTDKNSVIYSTNLKPNHWTKALREYYTNWLIRVYANNVMIDEHRFNLENKHVYIALESSAIGDTLAWFPPIEEFRKKHNCKITVSTFHNEWFVGQYPEINFIEPGAVAFDIYAMYGIGWYYDNTKINYNKTPINFRLRSLQETATSILNLPKMQIKPKLNLPEKRTNIEGKYVVIAPHASAHAKYWNKKDGWQTVINFLVSKGYKVVMITKEPLGDSWHDGKLGGKLYNVIDKTGDSYSIEDRMIDIRDAELFIGVGSGLSWLSWAIGTKTVLISGFSFPYTEFSDSIRIFNNNPSVCSGCFNKHWLDPSDWDWCPEQKGTERMFECTKTIKPDKVIDEISEYFNF